MHILYTLSTLFLQPLLAIPATAPILTSPDSLASPISLTFDLFGSRIPSSAVNALFRGAITKIQPFLQHRPDDPITDDEFWYRTVGGSVRIGVAAAVRHAISWQDLDTALRKVSGFMNGDVGGSQHMQELTFEISKGGNRVGEGFVLSDAPPIDLKDADDTGLLLARADLTLAVLNTTAHSALKPLQVGSQFPVPDSSIIIDFRYCRVIIPPDVLDDTLSAMLDQIDRFLPAQKAEPIPGNTLFKAHEGVRVTIFAKVGKVLSWDQVHSIVKGLVLIVTEAVDFRRTMKFEAEDFHTGRFAYGQVQYRPPKTMES